MAIAALVVALASVLGFFLLIVPPLVAIVLAGVALRRISANPAKTGKGMAVAALVIGIVLVIGGVALDAVIVANIGDRVQYTSLVAGDCILKPTGGVHVYRTDCDESHRREVFYVFDDPAGSSAPYPGVAALRQEAEDKCNAHFQEYVGTPPGRSELRILFLYPKTSLWENDGGRRIVCMAGTTDDSSLSSSVRSSGR